MVWSFCQTYASHMCIRGAVEADQTRTSDIWHTVLPYDNARLWIGACSVASFNNRNKVSVASHDKGKAAVSVALFNNCGKVASRDKGKTAVSVASFINRDKVSVASRDKGKTAVSVASFNNHDKVASCDKDKTAVSVASHDKGRCSIIQQF